MAEENTALSVASTQALTAKETGFVPRPVVSPEIAKQVIVEWEDLKKAIATEEDIHRETRSAKQKDGTYKEVEVAYYKKSYWRKAATFLGISVEPVENTESFRVINGARIASVTYRASGPNQRSVAGDGHCANDEGGKQYWKVANLLATAHTRAYNRAVSNYIGGGEVSAEEMDFETPPEGAPAERPGRSATAVFDLINALRDDIRHAKNSDDCRLVWKRIHANRGQLGTATEQELKSEVAAKAAQLKQQEEGGNEH